MAWRASGAPMVSFITQRWVARGVQPARCLCWISQHATFAWQADIRLKGLSSARCAAPVATRQSQGRASVHRVLWEHSSAQTAKSYVMRALRGRTPPKQDRFAAMVSARKDTNLTTTGRDALHAIVAAPLARARARDVLRASTVAFRPHAVIRVALVLVGPTH